MSVDGTSHFAVDEGAQLYVEQQRSARKFDVDIRVATFLWNIGIGLRIC